MIGLVSGSPAESRVSTAGSGTHDRLPVRYYAFAHLCLLLAFGALALTPRSIAGFHYHPRMVAVVHLVTLGWVSSSILGSLYMIGPMTLGIPLLRRRLDSWAFWIFTVGTLGMTSHFWLDEPRGMVWSAGMVIVGFGLVGGRVVAGLPAARLPPEVKVYFYLAFANLALAASLGFLVGLDKFVPVLPGNSLSNVYAHAHLAAIGWVLPLIMGAGYRLLPMLLPAASPRGRHLWIGATTLEVGALGLASSLLAQSALAPIFGLLVLAAIAIFLSRVAWMLKQRRPPARGLPQPDHGVRQVFLALGSLVVAAVLGAAILVAPDAQWKLPATMAYGVFGLLGFFGQMIVGVATRLVPWHAYLGAPVGPDCSRLAPPPYTLPSRRLERTIFYLWAPGVPLLALSLSFDWILWIRISSLVLAGAVTVGLLSLRLTLRRAGRGSRTPDGA